MAQAAIVLKALILAALVAHVAAAAAHALGRRRAGEALFTSGFALMAGVVACRWVQVRHVPLQNLFEFFLCLGLLIYPLSLLWHRGMGLGARAVDALLGAVVLVPAAFVFAAQPGPLPPALRSHLFGPHVLAYGLAYVVLSRATVEAGAALLRPHAGRDAATHRLVRLAFPLLSLGLVLGSLWGRRAWGDYWNWDPKELWALATWLVFVTYLHFRRAFGARYPRANAALVLWGGATAALSLLWVNVAPGIFPGLHVYAT